MVTDSGLGGLSVCAGLEQSLSKQGRGIELLYVNATPDDRIGYNALATQVERIELFDKFLKGATSRYAPEEIVIACNTLSVIYDQTDYAKTSPIEVKGIVEAGVDICNESLKQPGWQDLIIFATETTTEADTYPRSIRTQPSNVVPQPCPELAHAISNDSSGVASRQLLDEYISNALLQFDISPKSVLAFLGCTHYGYQANLFESLLTERGVSSKILNPNDLLIQQLQQGLEGKDDQVGDDFTIRFVSRYPIPQVEINAMVDYLGKTAPLTLAALQSHEVEPDLFTQLI